MYRFAADGERGYVFGSLLPLADVERTVRDVVCRDPGPETTVTSSTLDHIAVKVAHDPELETTVVFAILSPHLADSVGAAALALRVAAAMRGRRADRAWRHETGRWGVLSRGEVRST